MMVEDGEGRVHTEERVLPLESAEALAIAVLALIAREKPADQLDAVETDGGTTHH